MNQQYNQSIIEGALPGIEGALPGALNIFDMPNFHHFSGLQIGTHFRKLFFLFLSPNLYCGYSKELSQ